MTKQQSAMLQGIAILMMVYHHLFSFAETYDSLLPFMTVDTVRRIAWFCKICVGLFAFVSGYGMYHVMNGKRQVSFFGGLLTEYRCVLVRILRLYGKLWLVLLIFKGIDFLILGQPFSAGELPGNLTALNPTYNGAWWYVEEYAKMLLVLPLLDLLFARYETPAEKKKKRGFFLALAVLGLAAGLTGLLWWRPLWELLLAAAKSMRISFLLVFIVGYLTARYALYQKADGWLRRCGGWLPVPVSAALIAGVIFLRVRLATDASYAEWDFVLTPLLVYGLLTLLAYVPPLCRFLAWWGHQSTYMWLTHVFFYEWLHLRIKQYMHQEIWVYAAVLLASAAASLVLRGLGYLLQRMRKKRRCASGIN